MTNVAPASKVTGMPESSLAVIVNDCATPAVASVNDDPEAELIEAQISGRRPAEAACDWGSGAHAASNNARRALTILVIPEDLFLLSTTLYIKLQSIALN